jgi:hypothetical protein
MAVRSLNWLYACAKEFPRRGIVQHIHMILKRPLSQYMQAAVIQYRSGSYRLPSIDIGVVDAM